MCLCRCCTLLCCGSLGKPYWQQSTRVLIPVHLHRVCSKAAPAFPPLAVQLCSVTDTRDENVTLSHWNADGQRSCTGLSPSAVYFTDFVVQTRTSFETFQKAVQFSSALCHTQVGHNTFLPCHWSLHVASPLGQGCLSCACLGLGIVQVLMRDLQKLL